MRSLVLALFLVACSRPEPKSKVEPTSCGEDLDGDGFRACEDCDDTDPGRFPGAQDLCDGVDNDCDGVVDLGTDGVGTCVHEDTAIVDVDLLFVVDNSCSMGNEAIPISLQLAGTFAATMATTEVDYHVGVVSTDMFDSSHSGRLRQAGGVRWIEPTTPNAPQIFSAMIEMGTTGSSTTMGLDTMVNALDPTSTAAAYNEGFLRPDSKLAVVFLSDGNDETVGVPLEDRRDFLLALRSPENVRVHSIVGPEDPPCTDVIVPGVDYLWLTEQIGGIAHPICEDWTATLTEIAATYGNDKDYRLPEPADPTSLAAIIEGGPYPPYVEYSAEELTLVDGATLVRLPEPAPLGALVRIFYAPAP